MIVDHYYLLAERELWCSQKETTDTPCIEDDMGYACLGGDGTTTGMLFNAEDRISGSGGTHNQPISSTGKEDGTELPLEAARRGIGGWG